MGIIIKTEKEIQSMREGGKILAELLEELLKRSIAGTSTYELDVFAENYIKNKNAIPSFKGYQGFPATICVAVNEEIVHGVPKKEKILKEGDLFTIDCGVLYQGLHTDAARSTIIGKKSDPKRLKLIETSKQALSEAINKATPGTKLNEIGKTIQTIVEKNGYHIIKDLTGHGVGRKLHETPIINNYDNAQPGPELKPGMTLAIEPIFAVGTSEMITQQDKWTLVTADGSDAVQYENTILITKNGNEILTKI